METREMKVFVQNVPEKIGKKYAVARLSEGKLWYWGRWDTMEEAQNIAEDIDGIVLEEIKEGKWVHQNDDQNDWWICSECEWEYYSVLSLTNYCPSCGTKMANWLKGD